MSFKVCDYKDCESCIVGGVPCGNFTLFQFPKDPERRKKWFELGKVGKPESSPPHNLSMCSKHFDKKFFSINQRRTILVGAAVPFPYEPAKEAEENLKIVEDSSETCEESLSPDGADRTEVMFDLDLYSDSLKHDYEIDVKDNDNESSVSVAPLKEHADDIQEEVLVLVSKPNSIANTDDGDHNPEDSKERKRKYETLTIADGKRRKSQSRQNEVLTESLQANGHDKTTAILDSKHVTTFIFKGEEYLQMPKQYYIGEKVALLRQIKKYEAAISNAKSCLESKRF